MDGIKIEHVTKTYSDQRGKSFYALNGISLDWKQTENIAVVGASGSGKSTLARLVIGFERPTSGRIILDGEDVTGWGYRRWQKERKKVQAVFQDSSGTLNPMQSVYHNVEEALCNLTNLRSQERKKRILELMEQVGIDETLLSTPVRQLSGGEQRRLSLLRALSVQPKYLILDEVTSGLDLLSSDRVLTLLENYHHQYGCSYLLITHEMEVARRLCSHIFELSSGRLVRKGTRINQNNLVNRKEELTCVDGTKNSHPSFWQQRSAWVG